MEDGSDPTFLLQTESGPGWTFWAILLSAFIALLAIATQRTIAKRRAAIDLILVSETVAFKSERAELLDALREGDGAAIMNPQSGKDHERRRCISNVLNHYELVAIAIEHRTVDEEIMKQYQYSLITSTWDTCAKIIKLINEKNQATAYENFARLADRWKKNPVKKMSTKQRLFAMLREIVPWKWQPIGMSPRAVTNSSSTQSPP